MAHVSEPPAVVLVVGVNGSGKTTTIGKLASRFKNELLSHVSAEARGPLTAIIGFSGMLESGELSPARATNDGLSRKSAGG